MQLLSKIAPHYVFLLAYVLIRGLSFATFGEPLLNQTIAALLIGAFAVVAYKQLSLAWLLLLAEIFLDGAGHFFELFGFLLRTWFLGIFVLIWLLKTKEKNVSWLPKQIRLSMMVFGAFLLFAVVNGFIHDHRLMFILQDTILFLFFLLLFPAHELQKHFSASISITHLAKAYILGSALFSFITFFLYSSGIFLLKNPFYHWFRNVASGKITDLGNHFFRIVLPEHIFIVPAILILAALLMKEPKKKSLWFFIICALFVLVVNFTRIYFVGLAVGLLFLFLKEKFARWFTISALVSILMIVLFSLTSFVASRTTSLGLDLLGLKFGGVRAPAEDVSGAIRLAILPDAKRQIQENPILGSGLGASVTYTDPVSKERVTRTQFDWGYFELLAEFGILGVVAFLTFLILVLRHLWHAIGSNPLLLGLFAGGISLFVINITTPALFYGFGMLYFAAIYIVTIK